MSLSRKTYFPMTHTYSYASTVTPAYSYQRASTQVDALQRDEQIIKLKKEITNVKSLEMKYYGLLQEISIAEKENKMLEVKNGNLEQEYVAKIQEARKNNSEIESQLKNFGSRLSEEQKNVQSIEKEIQHFLEQLKQLKVEEELVKKHNSQLQTQMDACKRHITQLTQQQTQMSAQKSALCGDSKQFTQQMQSSMKKLSELSDQIIKYTQQIDLLQSQRQCFSLQDKNMENLRGKNATLIQNLQRKITIQEGENMQLKNQLDSAQKQCENMQAKFIADKDSLYQNVIKVQQHSLVLKENLQDLDRFLETDCTEKKYLGDISNKQSILIGQNQQMRQLLKNLKETFNQKKTQLRVLVQEVNRKLISDESVKCAIGQRDQQLNMLRSKFAN